MPFDPVTGPDYARLKGVANNSKFQTEQNAAYQALIGLMDGLKKFQDVVSGNFSNSVFAQDLLAQLAQFTPMAIVELTGPVSVELSQYCTPAGKLIIFKDVAGTASSDNITLVGDVEGVTDPVINTDYGVYYAYLSAADGEFHTW